MSQSPWQTNSSLEKRANVNWPSPSQVLRQSGLILITGALWGGLLALALGATSPPRAPQTLPTQVVAVSAPTVVPALSPTSNVAPTRATTLAAATVTPTAIKPPAAAATDTPAAGAARGAVAVSFAQEVLPVLERRCVNCHGGERIDAGLGLETYADVMKGSENGPVVEPRNPGSSSLIQLIESGKMPKRGPRLLPAEIQSLKEWIQAGAPNN
jgi:mono/diheme cytochrome c family protein